MSPLRCLIVEDQPPAQRILQAFIADAGNLELLATFSDPLAARDYLLTQSVDLLFLDIQLPKLSGTDLLRVLPQPPLVILTTAYSEYALQGYELDVVDYLLKPFSFSRFLKAVNKARAALPSAREDLPTSLFVKSGHTHIQIQLADIRFLQADGGYTEIHLPGKKHLSTDPLRVWQTRLPQPQFCRVHKSYIVPLDQVAKVAGNQLYLRDGPALPLGRAYKEAFMAHIEGREG